MNKIPEGTQYIESGCGEKGFRKYEKGCWWFFEGYWRRVDWQMGDLIPVSEHPFYVDQPGAWNGEGPPPVGMVCEVTTNDGHNWHPWKVLFADEYVILVGSAEGKANYELLRRCDADVAFRPIRAAEQIAADERELALTDMCVLLGKDPSRPGVREMAGVLFDAGYRKQVSQ